MHLSYVNLQFTVKQLPSHRWKNCLIHKVFFLSEIWLKRMATKSTLLVVNIIQSHWGFKHLQHQVRVWPIDKQKKSGCPAIAVVTHFPLKLLWPRFDPRRSQQVCFLWVILISLTQRSHKSQHQYTWEQFVKVVHLIS